jgi:hypothetical protein
MPAFEESSILISVTLNPTTAHRDFAPALRHTDESDTYKLRKI